MVLARFALILVILVASFAQVLALVLVLVLVSFALVS